MYLTLALVLYILIALSLVVSLLVNGVRPSKTLAWLLAIFTIPVAGILFYLMLGRNRRNKKIVKIGKSMAKPMGTDFSPLIKKASKSHSKIMRLIYKNCRFLPSSNNDLILLKDGRSTFESIFETMENAQEFIHLQYYIFEDGELADKLLVLFRRKITEGVTVRMIYDSIGSYSLSRNYLGKLELAGVKVYPFLPYRFGRLLTSLNYRNHRKIIVVDGIHAFTGGINISDKYVKGDPLLGKWHDLHLKISGDAATDLNRIFMIDWLAVADERLDFPMQISTHKSDREKSVVQIVHSGPDDDFPAIEQVYFSMITEAANYLYVANPYLIPGNAILTALETAALSGVDVRLLLSAHNDSRVLNWGVRSYFETLLRAGAKIYLFPDGFLHSKMMLSDDSIASIGTANIDIRSFEQNYEVNAILYDTEFIEKLRADFLRNCEKSDRLSYSDHLERPWSHKLKEGVAKIFSPLL
tara:strand:- start:191649 stop:193055 length:1407 start_codon:yes stop_codon:yes gene_type:complete